MRWTGSNAMGTAHSSRYRGCIVFVALAMAVGATSQAAANSAPGDNGIMVGGARLHPFANVGQHWVTNPGRQSKGGHSDLMTSGRVGLSLDRPSKLLELSVKGSAEYRQYWGVQNSKTRNLSTPLGKLGLTAHLNRTGALNVKLEQQITRSAGPGAEAETVRLLHWINNTKAKLQYKPGGGALLLESGLGFFLDYYDRNPNNAATKPALLDNYRFLPEVRATWKFLHMTGVFVEALGELARYPDYTPETTGADGADSSAQATSGNVPASVMRFYLGARGLVTRRSTVLFKLGYGNSFVHDKLKQFSSFVGKLEFSTEVTELTRARFGFERDVKPTSTFRYLGGNKVYGGFSVQLLPKLSVSANLSYNLMMFGEKATSEEGDPNQRVDHNISLNLRAGYQIQEWATVGVFNNLGVRRSNWPRPDDSKTGYTTNDICIGINGRY